MGKSCWRMTSRTSTCSASKLARTRRHYLSSSRSACRCSTSLRSLRNQAFALSSSNAALTAPLPFSCLFRASARFFPVGYLFLFELSGRQPQTSKCCSVGVLFSGSLMVATVLLIDRKLPLLLWYSRELCNPLRRREAARWKLLNAE